MSKIKKIKDYLKNGTPHFDVILRREPGKTYKYHVIPDKDELPFSHDIEQVVSPPENGEGVIQIVKRINDDQIFHQGDVVEVNEIGSCFVVEFNEDLVHCKVATIFDQDAAMVPVNDLEVVVWETGDYEGLEGDLEEEL